MHDLDVLVTGVRRIAESLYALGLRAPEIAAEAQPGQFVNLLLRPGPLLRRPFSVYRVDAGVIEIVLKPVGTGTRMLVALEKGSRVGCLGPLGHGFEIDPEGGPVVLVSGGLGVAPMPLAARQARRLGLQVTWVHGARSAAELCPEWDGDSVVWATDDGSQGIRGSALGGIPGDAGQVFGCGPNPMLAALAAARPDAQVALETYMGCGTGVCLGCAVPRTGGGFDRACKEGPVYRAGDVDWATLPGHLHYGVMP